MKISILCFAVSSAAATIAKSISTTLSCGIDACDASKGWHGMKSTWRRQGFVHELHIASRSVLSKRNIEGNGVPQPVKQAKDPVKLQTPRSSSPPKISTTVEALSAHQAPAKKLLSASGKITNGEKQIAKQQSSKPRPPDANRNHFSLSQGGSNARFQSEQVTVKNKGQKLCRRGDDNVSCQSSTPRNGSPPRGGSPRSPMALLAPKRQTMSKVEDVEARKKMEATLATQASLDIRKAKNSKNSNRLTTGILGTSLTGSITSTSATLPGLCCHGMACGSHTITCASVATGSLGGAGICLGCIAAGITGYKAYRDHKNAKEMESKLDRAYGEVQRTKEDQASHDKRITEESVGRKQLAKEVGQNREQIERTSQTIGKHQEKLDHVDKTVSTTIRRVDSVKGDLDHTKDQVKLAFGRADSLGRGVADAKNQAMHASNSVDSIKATAEDAKSKAMHASNSVENIKATAEEAKLDASKASSSYGELKRTNSERFAEQAKMIRQMRNAMAKAGMEIELEPLMHGSPFY